jgi:hypothetical protein
MEDNDSSGRTGWWGTFELERGRLGRWRVGPLDLCVRRTEEDWRYGFSHSGDTLESTLEVEVPVADEDACELPEELGRFGFPETDAAIELVPLLADRAVVAHPSVPFFVPPGVRIELFVSTPVWIRLRAGGGDLAEVPCTRPSDTWVGTNTRGELGYATRTHLRRCLEEIPLRHHRAVSCVTIDNGSEEKLALERLSLPVPQLSLYGTRSGWLWTESVTVRHEDDDLAEVFLGEGPPHHAPDAERVSRPRAPQGSSFASLVFGGLFEANR